jgi:hypothetical protein
MLELTVALIQAIVALKKAGDWRCNILAAYTADEHADLVELELYVAGLCATAPPTARHALCRLFGAIGTATRPKSLHAPAERKQSASTRTLH